MIVWQPASPTGVILTDASVFRAARILVIEDKGADVFLLERALREQDFRFELVHLASGSAGLAFIRRQGAYAKAVTPDLILVDLNLSMYSGEDIMREIRSAAHLKGVPACLWSSSGPPRNNPQFAELGVSRFITKPSGLNQFMQIGQTLKDLLVDSRAAWCLPVAVKTRIVSPPA
jgi:chemotaxis family two-component system response regulator Rcp1